MAYVLEAIATVVLLLLCRFGYSYVQNFANARAIGLPMVFVPVDQVQLLWVLLAPLNREWLRRLLPAKFWERVSLTIFGWEFHEKLRPFDRFVPGHGDQDGDGNQKMSRSYPLVGLRQTELWTADPTTAQDVMARVRDFEVPHVMEYALGQYGSNVLTTNGDKWARHRKIVTSVIDERILREVFEESIRQTFGPLDEILLTGQGEPELNSKETPFLFDWLKWVTIHVLLGTSMGAKVPWKSSGGAVESGYKMSHIESLNTLVVNTMGVAMLPTKLLAGWPRWLPGHVKMTAVAYSKIEVHKRSKSILDQERERQERGETSTKPTIVSKIVRASEDGKASGHSLSEGEMISNLFAITAAGFKTTATTLAYGVVLLARYPRWQEWLLEEIDSLMVPANDLEPGMDYSAVFPRATRALAFMFETLRLYSPVSHVHRETASPQTLQTSAGAIRVPAKTRIYVNSVASHLLPSWRNRQSDPPFLQAEKEGMDRDEYAFRPSRWLNPPGSAQALYHQPKGTWVPWAMGPRVCPGMKMAQVEFSAALLTLLRRHRIHAAPMEGEGRSETEARLDARLRDSRWVTVLQMNGVFEPKGHEGLHLKVSRRG